MHDKNKMHGLWMRLRGREVSRHAVGPDPAELDSLLTQLSLAGCTRRTPPDVRRRLEDAVRLQENRARSRQARAVRARRWLLPLTAAVTLSIALLGLKILFFQPAQRAAIHSAVLSIGRWIGSQHAGSSLEASASGRYPQQAPAAGPVDGAVQISEADLSPSSSRTFSVPYSDPEIANGTAATIRVSLPDSELLAWGVPSLARDPDEMVPVNLTLGDDGLPQAVQLLSTLTSTSEETYP